MSKRRGLGDRIIAGLSKRDQEKLTELLKARIKAGKKTIAAIGRSNKKEPT